MLIGLLVYRGIYSMNIRIYRWMITYYNKIQTKDVTFSYPSNIRTVYEKEIFCDTLEHHFCLITLFKLFNVLEIMLSIWYTFFSNKLFNAFTNYWFILYGCL